MSLLHLAVILSVAFAFPAPSGARSEDGPAKIKLKDDRVIVRDKSKPVRRALEAQYARLADAIQRKDLEAFQSLRTADFSTIDLHGRVQTPEQMAARARVLLERIHPPIHVTITIATIDVKGDDARATIRQSFSRMQEVAGQRRRIVTYVTQDETWTKTPGGWKLKFVEGERDLEWYVDGKRIEPGKPYDPGAPPYEPEAPPGSTPG